MPTKIGFLINPIAGMGGRVGLKGTDNVVQQAKNLGAVPIASQKAEEMLQEFFSKKHPRAIDWYTCGGNMGNTVLESNGVKAKVIYTPHSDVTTAEDTQKACQKFLEEHIDILVFCGGDGTARDIFTIVDKMTPLLGIPSGVKMHSAVFGINTSATAKMLEEFIEGRLTIGDVEIMDLDEELYRKGEWKVRLFGIAKGIVEPTYIQVGKASYESVSDEAVKDELADHVKDELDKHPGTLFLFGPGSTVNHIAKKLGLGHTLLGIDAVYEKKVIGTDLNEQQILHLLVTYPKAKILLSPIGAQGFILGRGNLQLSPQVIQKVGIENIIVVATPSKLMHTPILRIDTGDKEVDRLFQDKGYFLVVIGYRLSRVVKIQTNSF